MAASGTSDEDDDDAAPNDVLPAVIVYLEALGVVVCQRKETISFWFGSRGLQSSQLVCAGWFGSIKMPSRAAEEGHFAAMMRCVATATMKWRRAAQHRTMWRIRLAAGREQRRIHGDDMRIRGDDDDGMRMAEWRRATTECAVCLLAIIPTSTLLSISPDVWW